MPFSWGRGREPAQRDSEDDPERRSWEGHHELPQ